MPPPKNQITKPKVHIYLLSKLAFADVTDWRKIMRDLRQGRRGMYWSYKPLREGAYRMAAEENPDVRAIYSDVASLAEKAGGDRCRIANVAALKTFEKKFLDGITSVRSNFMQGAEQPVEFGEVELVGGPHFSILDADGIERYVYLHPSNWKGEEVNAFCELLTVVVEKRRQASARDVWFLDLRLGQKVPWNSSKKLVRRKCEQAAEFLVAFQAANLPEEEA
jgi:hypothetical protein